MSHRNICPLSTRSHLIITVKSQKYQRKGKSCQLAVHQKTPTQMATVSLERAKTSSIRAIV